MLLHLGLNTTGIIVASVKVCHCSGALVLVFHGGMFVSRMGCMVWWQSHFAHSLHDPLALVNLRNQSLLKINSLENDKFLGHHAIFRVGEM